MFFEKKDMTRALLQEPYCFKGRVRKLRQSELIYERKIDEARAGPRACIMCKRGLKYLVLNNYCNRDMATIELNLGGLGSSSSRYWLRNAFCNYWVRAPKMKFTHEMILNPSQRRSKSLIDLSKKKLRILTMFLTGLEFSELI